MSNQHRWDRFGMELAAVAAGMSKDPSGGVGAALLDPRRRVVAVGFNGFPRGVTDTDDRLQNRDVKLGLMAHAERNALDAAECSVVGHTLYTTLCPCSECAKSIIQRGVARLVFSAPAPGRALRWRTDFDRSLRVLQEAGVLTQEYAPSALTAAPPAGPNAETEDRSMEGEIPPAPLRTPSPHRALPSAQLNAPTQATLQLTPYPLPEAPLDPRATVMAERARLVNIPAQVLDYSGNRLFEDQGQRWVLYRTALVPSGRVPCMYFDDRDQAQTYARQLDPANTQKYSVVDRAPGGKELPYAV